MKITSIIFNTLAAVSLLGVIIITSILGYQYLDDSSDVVLLEQDDTGKSKVTIAMQGDVAMFSARTAQQPVISEVRAATSIPEPTQVKSKPLISLYPDDSGKNSAFTTLEYNKNEIVVLTVGDEWSEVFSSNGLPVWIRGDMIREYYKGYVEVIVNSARTRSRPNTENGVVMGNVSKGEVLKVSRKQDEWVRVWSPIRFRTWAKTTDLDTL